MNGKEFVASLVEEMERLFAQLGEIDTLESESDGEVDVVTLLRLALKSELEASELAGFWMPTTPEVDGKMVHSKHKSGWFPNYDELAPKVKALT